MVPKLGELLSPLKHLVVVARVRLPEPLRDGEQLAQRYCRASRTEVPPSPPPPPPNPPIYRDPTSSWLQPHGSMGDPYVAWNAYGQPLSVRARPVLRQYLF